MIPQKFICDVIVGKQQDDSVVFLNKKQMEQMNIFKGDVVNIISDVNHKNIIGIALNDQKNAPNFISLSQNMIENLTVNGEYPKSVRVAPCQQLPYCQKLEINVSSVIQNQLIQMVKKYFQDTYRPVMQGMFFSIIHKQQKLKLEIVRILASKQGIVVPKTNIFVNQLNISGNSSLQ